MGNFAHSCRKEKIASMHSEPPLSDGTVGRSRRTLWCALLILSVLCGVFGRMHDRSYADLDGKKGIKEKYFLRKMPFLYSFTPYTVRC